MTETLALQESQPNSTDKLEAHAPEAAAFSLPVVRRSRELDLAAFDKSYCEWRAVLDAAGITEQDAVKDFEEWRRAGRP